jgi:LytS/YehU family sensor histidine kinase
MIGRLGDLLRHALRTTERQQVSLEEELALLNAYLTFVEARFGDRVRVDIDVDPAVLAIAVPTLLLQPLIENAVQYGAACEHGEAHVLVSITRDGGHLLLIVENDASPLPPLAESRTPARVGTGLATSRDRLRILHGSRASLDTSLANGRFRVTIRVPLHAAERVLPVLMEERASADR